MIMTADGSKGRKVEGFLKKISLFRNLSEEHLACIARDFKVISADRDEDIVFQSDEGTDFYVVLEGRVKASLQGPHGNEFILTTLREGEFFGEMSLIDGKSRSANIIAEEKTLLAVLKREVFYNTMRKNPEIAFDLLSALVGRLRKADDMIETLAFLDVNERLLKFLADCAKREGEKDGNGNYRMRKRTHLEIASHIGSSREAVSKALKVLFLNNKISENEGCFFITPEVLNEITDV
jgi:CRP/FNR family cyclic AMP-dependent transcriptional regulator